MVVGALAALEETTVCLGFGAISMVKSMKRYEKKLETLWVLRKLKSF